MNARSEVRQQASQRAATPDICELVALVEKDAQIDFFNKIEGLGNCPRCNSHRLRVFTKTTPHGTVLCAYACDHCGAQRA